MPLNTANHAANALNIGTVGIVGTFLGMPLEALILGAIAGSVAHGLSGATTRSRGIAAIMASTLLAGALSPAAVGWLSLKLGMPPEVLKAAVPVAIGAAWPWAMPHLADGLKRIWEALVHKCVKWFGGAP